MPGAEGGVRGPGWVGGRGGEMGRRKAGEDSREVFVQLGAWAVCRVRKRCIQGHRLTNRDLCDHPKATTQTKEPRKSQGDCSRLSKADPAGKAWSSGLRKGSGPLLHPSQGVTFPELGGSSSPPRSAPPWGAPGEVAYWPKGGLR